MSRRDRSLGLGRALRVLAWHRRDCGARRLHARSVGPAATSRAASTRAGGVTGEVLGSGEVRVALLLPRSARGNGGATATAFRNAAELAMRDFPDAGIQVAVYDDKGTPAGAQAAVGTALKEGAEIILGPVFSA